MKGLSNSSQQIFFLLLTVIRVAIGWHFLYEGLSKLFTPGWTSGDYLSNARGFLSPFYEWLASTPTSTAVVDFLNIWGLILIGLALFVGAFTRFAAIGGALLLGLYYFAYLPFGGLDFGVPAEGNYLIVNKNLIEMLMLIGVACSPIQMLWGLDRLWATSRKGGSLAPNATAGRSVGRRALIKNLSTLPLLGVFGWLTVKDRENELDGVSGATVKLNDSKLIDLKGELPKGKLGKHAISRLIMGGNLIGGWAHARDLIYVSSLFKAYNSQKKIFETLLLAEKAGINAINITVGMFDFIQQYKKVYGGSLKTICQIYPSEEAPYEALNKAIDSGVDIVQMQGGWVDFCVRDGKIDLIEKCMSRAQQQGYTTGMGAHSVQSLMACKKYGLQPDFIMKTMHHDNYWSAHPRENRYPFQVDFKKHKDHNQFHDNIFCLFPEETNAYIQEVDIPVIGFKVLAGGAIEPKDGFQYAFDNGADFICVGMFDFQIVDDVNIAIEAIKNANRKRSWLA